MKTWRITKIAFTFSLLTSLLQADEVIIPSSILPEDTYMPPLNTTLVHQEQEARSKASLKKIENIVRSAVSTRAGKAHSHVTAHIGQENFAILEDVYKDPDLIQKKISLTIKKMSVKKAFEVINKLSDMSFVVDPNITGVVEDVQANNVPLAIALQLMLNSAQPRLGLVKTLGVWRIMHHDLAVEILKQKEQESRALDSANATHTMHHAKWDEHFKTRIEKLWTGFIGDANGKSGTFIAFDDNTKKVFFKGRIHQVENFKNMLKEIDLESPQIRLDVRVVIADKSFDETLGFQWSGRYDRAMKSRHLEFASFGAKQTVATPGSTSAVTTGGTTTTTTTPGTAGGPTVTTPFGAITDWSLNLIPGWKATDTVASVATRSGMFSLPFIFRNADYTKLLNLTLNAAENRHEIKTILKPSLLVNSDETAEILVGESMPLQTQVAESIGGSMSNVTTTQFKDIGIKVMVKPIVSPGSEAVFLDIFLENSTLSIPFQSITWQQNGTNQSIGYTIQTSRSKNRVILKSGQTTLISGLISNSTKTSKNGVPFLQDIPVLGFLFRGSKKIVEDKQLLIFITPVVIA